MSLSISNQCIPTQAGYEETLTSSQLEFSFLLQSFCQEASSFSAIFSLGVAQTVACLAKTQSFHLLSSLFRSPSRLPWIHRFSSGIGLLVEGGAFPIANELGRSGKLDFASWQEIVHGTFTMGTCKVISKQLKIGNVVMRHFVQDCAMVIVDLGCERGGLIETKQEGWIARMAKSEIASIRLEISAQLLVYTAPSLSYIRAKEEMKIETQKTQSLRLFDSLKGIFSPRLIASNGKTLKLSFLPQGRDQTKLVREAKDLIHRMEGEKIEGAHPTQVNPLDLLPPTARRRLKEIGTTQAKLADLIEGSWKYLCEDPSFLKEIHNRGALLTIYTITARRYFVQRLKSIEAENLNLLIEFGVEILLRNIPENEPFHIEGSGKHSRGQRRETNFTEIGKPKKLNPATPEEFKSLESEKPKIARWVKWSLAAWSEHLTSSDSKKHRSSTKKEQQILLETFEVVTRKFLRSLYPPIDPNFFYHEVLPVAERFIPFCDEILGKLDHPNLSEFHVPEPIGSLHQAPQMKDLHQLLSREGAASFPNSSKKTTHSFEKFLKIENANPRLAESAKELWRAFFQVDYFRERPLEEFENFLTIQLSRKESLEKEIAILFFPIARQILHLEFLSNNLKRKIIGEGAKASNEDSPFNFLIRAMAQSLMGIKEFQEITHMSGTNFHLLLDQLCGVKELDGIKNPNSLLEAKKAFRERGVAFEAARVYEKLHPNISALFPEILGDPPHLRIARREFEEARQFNLGRVMTAWRLDNQEADRHLTLIDIRNQLEVETDKIISQYEMSVYRPVKERTVTKMLEEIPTLKGKKRMAYLALRPEILTIIPIFVIEENDSLTALTSEQVDKFQKARKNHLNTEQLQREVRAALPGEQTAQDLKKILIRRNKQLASKAEKLFKLREPPSIEEMRELTDYLKLNFTRWLLHFHPAYAYFLGVDEKGEVSLPTREELDQLHQIPPCEKRLLYSHYKKGKKWEELSLEEKWKLHLYELASHAAFEKGVKPEKITGIASLVSPSNLGRSVLPRIWTNETIAQYANSLGLSFEKRRQIFLFFREEILREMIANQPT